MGIETVGLILSVAGTAYGIVGQQKQQAAAKKSANANRSQQMMEQQRARLETIRQSRIKRAAGLQAAANSGAGVSSTSEGAAAGVDNQMASNLGFLGASGVNATSGFKAQQESFQGESMANTGNTMKTVGGLVSSIGQPSASKAERLRKAREV